MRYLEELIYLVVFTVAIILVYKGAMALAKVAIGAAPAPEGLKSFVAG